jgi:hypothetical protein
MQNGITSFGDLWLNTDRLPGRYNGSSGKSEASSSHTGNASE